MKNKLNSIIDHTIGLHKLFQWLKINVFWNLSLQRFCGRPGQKKFFFTKKHWFYFEINITLHFSLNYNFFFHRISAHYVALHTIHSITSLRIFDERTLPCSEYWSTSTSSIGLLKPQTPAEERKLSVIPGLRGR